MTTTLSLHQLLNFFFDRSNDFNTNALGEKGNAVVDGFEYVSDKNPHFLTVDEISTFGKEDK